MPITNPFERIKYRNMGYDPDQVDLVTIDEPVPEPAPTASPEKVTPKVTATGSVIREMGRRFPATGTGIGVGALATAGLAPFMGPAAPIGGAVAGIGAGIATALGQEALVDKVLPDWMREKYRSYEQADREQNPTATTIGGIIPSAIAFRPSLSPLVGLKNLLTKGATVTPAQQASMANAALSGGIAGGSRALLDPEAGFDQIGLETLGGAALNKAYGPVGRALGMVKPAYNPQADLEAILKGNRSPMQLKQFNDAIPMQAVTTSREPTLADIAELLKQAPPSTSPRLPKTQGEVLREEFIRPAPKALPAPPEPTLSDIAARLDSIETRLAPQPETPPVPDALKPSAIDVEDLQATMQGNQVKGDLYNPKTNPQRDYTKRVQQANAEISPTVDPTDEILNKLKIDTKGKLYDAVQGVPVAVWNGAIDAAKVSLKSGKSANDAVAVARSWLKGNYPDAKVPDEVFNSIISKSIEQPVTTAPTKSVGEKVFDNSLGMARPEIDKIEAKGTQQAKDAADGLRNFFERQTELRGQYVNKFVRQFKDATGLSNPLKNVTNPGEYWNQSTADTKAVQKWFWDKKDGLEPTPLIPQQEKIKAAVQEPFRLIRAEQIERGGMKRGEAVEGFNPDYLPDTISNKVLKELTNNPESTKSAQLEEDWVRYHISKGMEAEKAQKAFDDFIFGLKDPASKNTTAGFGPLDKAEGLGIPRSWRDENLMETVTKYADRAARRTAYWDTIENNPKALAGIELYKAEPSMQAVWREVTGNRASSSGIFQAANSLISAGQLGPLTGGKDLVSGVFLGAQHQQNPLQGIKSLGSAIGNFKQNWTDAWDSGRIRHNQSSLELDMGIDDVTTGVRRLRDVTSEAFGRNGLEQVSRALNFGQGKWLAVDFFNRAKSGKLSKQTTDWFKNFGKDIDWKNKKELTSEDINRMAGRYVDSVQGTYDPRGLPRGATEGELAPILALSRWGIEKSNNFMKYTVKPAREGNYTPLINTTLATLVGGGAVQGLVQLTTGRKPKSAAVDELLAEPNATGTMHKLAALSSLAGHTGIMGDMLKAVLDRTYANDKPQEINNLLLEAGANAASIVSGVMQDWSQNGPNTESLIEGTLELVEDQLQAYRLIARRMDKDKLDKDNKVRDLRVFKQLSGRDVDDYSSSFPQPMGDKDIRKFKETQDLEEAKKLAPAIGQKLLKRNANDPEGLVKDIGSLKRNPYPTMPNLETEEDSFKAYYKFLVDTQGQEEADKRMKDFYDRKAVNDAKFEPTP